MTLTMGTMLIAKQEPIGEDQHGAESFLFLFLFLSEAPLLDACASFGMNACAFVGNVGKEHSIAAEEHDHALQHCLNAIYNCFGYDGNNLYERRRC